MLASHLVDQHVNLLLINGVYIHVLAKFIAFKNY